MPKVGLFVRAQFENCDALRVGADYEYEFRIACAHCREPFEKVRQMTLPRGMCLYQSDVHTSIARVRFCPCFFLTPDHTSVVFFTRHTTSRSP